MLDKKLLISTLVFLSLKFLSLPSYGVEQVSYYFLLNRALNASAKIAQARQQVKLARDDYDSGLALLVPQVSLLAYAGYLRTFSQGGFSYINGQLLQDSTGYGSSITVEVSLNSASFISGIHELGYAKYQVLAKKEILIYTKQKIALDLLSLYERALEDYQKLRVLRKIFLLEKQILTLKKQLYDKGIESYLELDNASMDVISTKFSIAKSRKDLEEALESMSYLTGKELNKVTLAPLDHTGNFTNCPSIEVTQPDMLYYHYRLRALSEEIENSKWEVAPSIDFNLSYDFSGFDESNLRRAFSSVKRNRYQVSIGITWHFGTVLGDFYKLRRKLDELYLLSLKENEVKRKFKAGCKSLCNDLQALNNQLSIYRRFVSKLESDVSKRSKLYSVGYQDKTKLLREKINLLRSKLELSLLNMRLKFTDHKVNILCKGIIQGE